MWIVAITSNISTYNIMDVISVSFKVFGEEGVCRVGEHQHRLSHQCSSCESWHTHPLVCEVKHNGDMGLGHS